MSGSTDRARRHDWVFAAAVAVVALAVFVPTLAPTVTAEDSGELIAAAWHFGLPHPPGYPLWTILCGAFIRVFAVGSVAFRANLFSALCSAAAAGVLFGALRQIGIGRLAAACAGLLVIWSRSCWSQSVITEVYALNSLLVAVLVWCVLRWYRTRHTGSLMCASVVMGLGMCNHHSIALAGLALVAWILILDCRVVRCWRLVPGCVGLFLASLTPYLYLPIRAAADPPINWGDPSTLSRFVDHVTRHQYGELGPIKATEARSIGRLGHQVAYVARSVSDDLTPWIALVAVGGLIVQAKRDRRLLMLVILWLMTTSVLFAWLANFDSDRTSQWGIRVFLIPVSLGLAIPIGVALDALFGWIRGLIKHPVAARSTISALAIAAPASVAAAHWRVCDYSDYWYAYDHGQNLFRCMMPDAIIFPSGDHSTFPLMYLQLVEGKRTDVLIADMYGYLTPDLYADQPADSTDSPEAWLIKHARRPVYYAVKHAPPVSHARFVTAGMLYHLLPDDMTFDDAGLLDQCDYRNRDQPTVIDLGASHIIADYAFFSGLSALEKRELPGALDHFERAASVGWGIKELFNNIGSALAENGYTDEATGYFEQAARLDRYYVMPRWNLFQIARAHQDWQGARRLLDEILKADPQNTRVLNALGRVLRDHFDDAQSARSFWRRSLEINPNQPDIIDLLTSQ